METNNKDILGKFRSLFNKVKEKFGRAELADGSLIEWVGELEEGSEVFLVVDDGLNPLEDGSYELMDGRSLSVEGGSVSAIQEAETEEADEEDMEEDNEEEEFAKTELVDGTVVEWDSEELKVGDNIYVVDEEGERSPAPNGNHETVEGLVVSVEDGIVEELDQMESEEEEEVEAENDDEEVEMDSDSVELDMDIELDDSIEETKENKEEFDEDSNPDEETKDLEAELDSLKKMVTELSEQLKLSNERLEKISKEPAVEKDDKKTVSNNFNKTKTKSRAAQILASGN